jgi:gliding motility-associated-like protein
MDMNTQSTEYETTFKWVPSILFSPPDSWNSSIYVDDAIYAQIHGYDTLMYDSQARRKINFTKIFGIDSTSVGCTDTLKLYLRLVDKLSFGNVFSPNGDGVNDVWLVPKDYLFPDLEIEIFNRWGSLVWSAKGDEAAKGWNGRTNKGNELPIGTYYYVIKFNIKTNDGKWKPINGSITIVR